MTMPEPRGKNDRPTSDLESYISNAAAQSRPCGAFRRFRRAHAFFEMSRRFANPHISSVARAAPLSTRPKTS